VTFTVIVSEHKYEDMTDDQIAEFGLVDSNASPSGFLRISHVVGPKNHRIGRVDPMENFGTISGVRITWVEEGH